MSAKNQLEEQLPSEGEIDHVNYLSQDIGALCLNDDYSDIALKVDGEILRAHKIILASRSEYFRAMLYGGMKESKQTEIELIDAGIVPFKLLLKYIYTGRLFLGCLKEDAVLEILGLAHLYGFQKLEAAISDFFMKSLSVQSVFSVYDAARLYQLNFLTETCKSFIDKDVAPILSTSFACFVPLSSEGLKEIIERDSFYAPEVQIFELVQHWAQENNMKGTPQLEDVLSAVRFELMSVEHFCRIVRPSGLVSSETILDALERQTIPTDDSLKYRGTLNVNVNMADPCFGSYIQSELKSALSDSNSLNYDLENCYMRHLIGDRGDSIIIKLGTQCVVNHIKMWLVDKDMRSYSYYIEVSIDQKEWIRVIDHSQFYCRSWQKLYFKQRVLNYVRIVGTHNTVNSIFHVLAFEIMYTNETVTLVSDIIKPTHNVATIEESASVIEGVCRSRNALLDGNFKEYDWNNGYTCHQIGSGTILIQLGQPYMLDSMRLLLWDCDLRSYSYYIEVSENRRSWEIVWDMRDTFCQSWQLITFQLRPVVFIRIIGTRNTANEIFHCVHFECPAQIEDKEITNDAKLATRASKESAN